MNPTSLYIMKGLPGNRSRFDAILAKSRSLPNSAFNGGAGGNAHHQRRQLHHQRSSTVHHHHMDHHGGGHDVHEAASAPLNVLRGDPSIIQAPGSGGLEQNGDGAKINRFVTS